MKRIIALFITLSLFVGKIFAQQDTIPTLTPIDINSTWRQSPLPPWMESDTIRALYYNGATYIRVIASDGKWPITFLGIKGNGVSQSTKLQIAANKNYINTVVFSADSGRQITLSSSINMHGKTLEFGQGVSITGTVTIDSAVINAPFNSKIFGPNVTLTNVRYTGNYFSTAWYTGLGNGVTDVTTEYRKVASIANITSYVPFSSADLIVSDSILFNNTQGHIMDGRVTSTVTANYSTLIFGTPGGNSSTVPRKIKYKINIVRSTQSTYLTVDSSNGGALFRNQYYCDIEVTEASNFNTGAEFRGDGFGFSYNSVKLFLIRNCRTSAYLSTKGTGLSGWCNDNEFFGGELTNTSSINSGVVRWGIKVGTTDYLCNNNVFYKPSIELNSSVGIPIYIKSGQGTKVLNFRNEANSTTTVLIDRHNTYNGNSQNYFLTGYQCGTMVDNSQNGGNIFECVNTRIVTRTNVITVAESKNLAEQAVYYNGTTDSTISLYGDFSVCSTTGGTPSISSGSMRIINNYIQVLGGVGIVSKKIYTDVQKIFIIRSQSNTSRHGRYRIRIMNALGQVIDSTVKIQAYGGTVAWNSSFGGSWGTQTDSDADLQVIVPDSAYSMYIYYTSGSQSLELRSASVFAITSGSSSSQSRNTANASMVNVALQPPGLGNYLAGKWIQNVAQTDGSIFGWINDSTGTAGPDLINTGSITSGTNKLLLSSGGGDSIRIGQYLSINSVARRIISRTLDTVWLETNATATLSPGSSIRFFRPVFRPVGVTGMFYSGTGDPNGSQTGTPGSVYLRRTVGVSNFYIKTTAKDDNTGWVVPSGGGGGGTDNFNIVSGGYRWLVPSTQGMKSLFVSYGLIADSSSNTNGITLKVDTSQLVTQFDLSTAIETALSNAGTVGIYGENIDDGVRTDSVYKKVNDSTFGYNRPAAELGASVRTTSSQIIFSANYTKGRYISSGTGSTSTFTITHSLGAIPTSVAVTIGSEDAEFIFHTGNYTSTTFDVILSAAPILGINNVIINWQAFK